MLLMDEDGILLTESAGVLTLTMSRGENRINPTMVALLERALALAADADGPKALIVTSSDAKFFCNGLDIEWMATHGATAVMTMLESFWAWLARLLVLGCPTVAAITGHAFGAGAFLALSCDYRIMRTERGFLNFPEAALGMRLQKQFAELAKAKLDAPTLRKGMLEAHRFGSDEALACGFVDSIYAMEQLPAAAQAMAVSKRADTLKLINFNAENFSAMKKEIWTDAYRALVRPGDAAPDARL